MAFYECIICGEDRHKDIHGCNEHPKYPYECICDSCEENYPENDEDLEIL